MTVRFGVIGAGMIGTEHALRVNNVLTGAEVVAVNDVNAAGSKRLADSLGGDVKVYDNGHDLIKADNVDAVMVTSWGPTHEEFVLSAIEAGKYVFCEKPLATTAEGCQRIVDAEVKAGKRLVMVGFMRRFDKGYRQLKAAIDAGEIGEPLMLHCAHRNPEVGEAYVTPMAIQDTLVHELDVLRWLLDDDYKTVQVVFPRSTKYSHSKLRDPQIVLMETVKGIRIDVEIFVNCKYGYDIQCSVVGEDGIANLPEPQSLLVRKDAKLYTTVLTDWKKRFVDSYDVELQDFIDGIGSGNLPGPTAWDGFCASVASDACVLAQETGAIESVTMPPRPDFYD